MGKQLDKKTLTERDICTKFITPALDKAGWDIQTQIREELYFTKGKVIVRGKTVKRGLSHKADYVLYHKPNQMIAVLEAKDNCHKVGDGMEQAIKYAKILDVPFAFSSNGDGFLFHDLTGHSEKAEQHLTLQQFPHPIELWKRYCAWRGIDHNIEPVVTQEYYVDADGKEPRYYQQIAINRTVEAVAKGNDRVLLCMATGTGKTYTAFQIIWRLWKSGAKKRILFFADRNILVDQTRVNDFKPFGTAMTKISDRTIDKSYEIYLCLYQAVTGNEEDKNIYRQFSPDFFDLIVIDECHRGSARDDSAWRAPLEYFKDATQIGLTATPKETKDVSNTHYFGDPIYTYSLRQGIDDGFLAPYKVVRIDFDKDYGWRPKKGQVDSRGTVIPDRVYEQPDMDRTLVLEHRTKRVAEKVTEFLKATNRYDKTIVFCEDVEHAERMRQEIGNLNSDIFAQNPNYIMRITGDNPEGKAALDQFIDPYETYPVVATTSRLMTTGVDAQTCKLIVLDRTIRSMTDFKQIIGRGTRLRPDFGKEYFTIMDFRRATELFADPDFDGDPEQIYDPKDGDSPVPPAPSDDEEPDNDPDEVIFPDRKGKRVKYHVKGEPVFVAAERVQYYGPNGRLITESLKDYTRNIVTQQFRSLDEFLNKWTEAERKQAIIEELEQEGVLFEPLEEEMGPGCGAFDLICHIAFDSPLVTRRQRADKAKSELDFSQYSDQARAVLDALLDKYATEGVEELETMEILKIPPLNSLGTPIEIVRAFGGKGKYLAAINDLKSHLYRPTAA